MARIRLVSRTIKTYTYKVTVFDKETDKLLTVERIITGDKPTEKELLSELSTNTQVAVKADFVSYKEDMYVMKETDFIKYAHKTLDGKRSITDDTETTENSDTETETENA